MSSQLQIEANRRNAQHSTGPRTPEGKAVSRFNALKTGIEAKSQIIPSEDAGELESLSGDYYLEWQPATPTECILVDELVRADWQLRRLSRAEAQLWTHELVDAAKSFRGLSKEAPLGQVVARSYHQFHFLQRRIDSAERALYRALAELRRLRETSPGPEIAAPARDPQTLTPDTTQIGFVPSTPPLTPDPLRYNPPFNPPGEPENPHLRSAGLPQAGHPVLAPLLKDACGFGTVIDSLNGVRQRDSAGAHGAAWVYAARQPESFRRSADAAVHQPAEVEPGGVGEGAVEQSVREDFGCDWLVSLDRVGNSPFAGQ